MKHIALFCVSYESDKELDYYRQSLNKAVEKAKDEICLDFFVAHNSKENNPGYFGAIKRLMTDVDIKEYDSISGVVIVFLDLDIEFCPVITPCQLIVSAYLFYRLD